MVVVGGVFQAGGNTGGTISCQTLETLQPLCASVPPDDAFFLEIMLRARGCVCRQPAVAGVTALCEEVADLLKAAQQGNCDASLSDNLD